MFKIHPDISLEIMSLAPPKFKLVVPVIPSYINIIQFFFILIITIYKITCFNYLVYIYIFFFSCLFFSPKLIWCQGMSTVFPTVYSGPSTVYSIIITVQCILIEYVKTQSNMGRIHFLGELEFCLETVSTSTSS